MAKKFLFIKLDRSSLDQLNDFMSRMMTKMDLRGNQRATAIRLSNQGRTIPEIAEQLNRSVWSVYRWLSNYQKFGLAGITPKSRPSKLTPSQINELMKIIGWEDVFKTKKDLQEVWSSRKIAKWVKYNWNIKISHERVRQIIRKKMIE